MSFDIYNEYYSKCLCGQYWHGEFFLDDCDDTTFLDSINDELNENDVVQFHYMQYENITAAYYTYKEKTDCEITLYERIPVSIDVFYIILEYYDVNNYKDKLYNHEILESIEPQSSLLFTLDPLYVKDGNECEYCEMINITVCYTQCLNCNKLKITKTNDLCIDCAKEFIVCEMCGIIENLYSNWYTPTEQEKLEKYYSNSGMICYDCYDY